MHVNVIPVPTARWCAQQLIEAFPFNTAPRFLIHDRDPLFMAGKFQRWIEHLGSEDVPKAPRLLQSRWWAGRTIDIAAPPDQVGLPSDPTV